MANPRILVVDDYPGARYRRMRILLDDGGFDVTEEMMGREAIRRAAARRAEQAGADGFLTDTISAEALLEAIRDALQKAAIR